MEDLRKNNFTKKKEVGKKSKVNIFAVIVGAFRYIRSKWKSFLFWALIILAINIIFNPENTANFISNWYDSFVGTIIENSNE